MYDVWKSINAKIPSGLRVVFIFNSPGNSCDISTCHCLINSLRDMDWVGSKQLKPS